MYYHIYICYIIYTHYTSYTTMSLLNIPAEYPMNIHTLWGRPQSWFVALLLLDQWPWRYSHGGRGKPMGDLFHWLEATSLYLCSYYLLYNAYMLIAIVFFLLILVLLMWRVFHGPPICCQRQRKTMKKRLQLDLLCAIGENQGWYFELFSQGDGW